MAIKTSNIINANTTASSSCISGGPCAPCLECCTVAGQIIIKNNSSQTLSIYDDNSNAFINTIAPSATGTYTAAVLVNVPSGSLNAAVSTINPIGTCSSQYNLTATGSRYPFGIIVTGCIVYTITNI